LRDRGDPFAFEGWDDQSGGMGDRCLCIGAVARERASCVFARVGTSR
jgi:hypothetical protein